MSNFQVSTWQLKWLAMTRPPWICPPGSPHPVCRSGSRSPVCKEMPEGSKNFATDQRIKIVWWFEFFTCFMGRFWLSHFDLLKLSLAVKIKQHKLMEYTYQVQLDWLSLTYTRIVETLQDGIVFTESLEVPMSGKPSTLLSMPMTITPPWLAKTCFKEDKHQSHRIHKYQSAVTWLWKSLKISALAFSPRATTSEPPHLDAALIPFSRRKALSQASSNLLGIIWDISLLKQ